LQFKYTREQRKEAVTPLGGTTRELGEKRTNKGRFLRATCKATKKVLLWEHLDPQEKKKEKYGWEKPETLFTSQKEMGTENIQRS